MVGFIVYHRRFFIDKQAGTCLVCLTSCPKLLSTVPASSPSTLLYSIFPENDIPAYYRPSLRETRDLGLEAVRHFHVRSLRDLLYSPIFDASPYLAIIGFNEHKYL
jgi:hypothetical protein